MLNNKLKINLLTTGLKKSHARTNRQNSEHTTLSLSFRNAMLFLPHPRVKASIVGSLRDREVACSASDRQGSNFESCVWRTVSSQSSHHPQEVLLAQFSLYVHKGGLKPDSFHFPKRDTYVSDLTDTRLIAAVAQLRISSHNLEKERGRHTRPKTPVANRICRRCQTIQVDDEIHFLLQCRPNMFELDRKALLSETVKNITNFNTQCDTEQFKSIMSSKNHAIINALAKYTYVCFEKIVV